MSRKRIKYIAGFLIVLVSIVLIIENSGKLMYPLKYKEQVFRYSRENSVDPYLIFAVIKAESNFDPKAISHKKARGLMQITEGTGNWGAESIGIENFSIESLYEPETSIAIGCWYIRWLMNEFEGNVDLVLAAYNGGSGRVNQWLKDKNYSSSGDNLDVIPYRETDLYVKKVKNYYITYKELYEKDF